MNKEHIVIRMVEYALHHLDQNTTYSSPSVPCRAHNRSHGSYYLMVSRPQPTSLLVQELFKSDNGVTIAYRIWSLKQSSYWDVVSVERLGKRIFLEDLAGELQDFDSNLDHVIRITADSGFYYSEETVDPVLSLSIPARRESLMTILDNYQARILGFASLALGVLLLATLTLHTITGFRNITRVRNEVDTQIDDIRIQSEERFEQVRNFMSSANSDLRSLRDNLLQSERDLEFNRHQARINVLRLAEELTHFRPSRKEAYRLIADNITEATSYGEIIYEMSRLPSEEYQARIFLATAREKIVPFSRFQPVFASMDYPVQLPGKRNDGKGFRITSTFMEQRPNPFGTGGYSPHFAIDIINVANISVINYAGEIKRDGNHPGHVVSVAPGFVRYNGWDDGFGWCLEIQHELTPEVMQKYPDAREWRTFYAHLTQQSELDIGNHVNRQQRLGYIGNTGMSTGPHLHFEVRIYRPGGQYSSSAGRFDKINPYPVMRRIEAPVPVN